MAFWGAFHTHSGGKKEKSQERKNPFHGMKTSSPPPAEESHLVITDENIDSDEVKLEVRRRAIALLESWGVELDDLD